MIISIASALSVLQYGQLFLLLEIETPQLRQLKIIFYKFSSIT